MFVWAVIEISLMLTYVELARRRGDVGTAPALPTPLGGSAGPVKEYVVETVEQISKPDGSMVTKTTKTTTSPDGHVKVESTEIPLQVMRAEIEAKA